MTLTFDEAIELLEITDISKITLDDIPVIEKKSKKRWHPDKVIHLQDSAITQEYTVKFQQIELACEMVSAYIKGIYKAGEPFNQSNQSFYQEPEQVIRDNAPDMQSTLRNFWPKIKDVKYKWSNKEVILSDGFVLKDLLTEDFKEDIAMLSVISLFYGLFIIGILSGIGYAISPIIGGIIGLVGVIQAIACILGFLPLSRFWLPAQVTDIMIKFINYGLGVYNWAENQIRNTDKTWVILLVKLPVLFAKLIKYIILFPLYELAKAFVGNKIVGVVKQNVNYYAEAAEWYIDELIHKNPNAMTSDEFFHLSYLYTELSDVRSVQEENKTESSPTNTNYNKNQNTDPYIDPQQNNTDKKNAIRDEVSPKENIRGKRSNTKRVVSLFIILLFITTLIILFIKDIISVNQLFGKSNENIELLPHATPELCLYRVSSELKPTKLFNYSATNLYDHNTSTAWGEGSKGNGIKEYIELTFPYYKINKYEKISLIGFEIVNGYSRKQETFIQNNTVRKMIIQHNGKIAATISVLPAFKEIQTIKISPIELKSGDIIKIIISEVNKGSKYNDTLLSELIPILAY